jgi:mRNA interferase MazF
MQRAEAWWAELPIFAGPRPVVILTRNAVVESIGSLVVGLVTRTIRGMPTEVRLGRREGLRHACVANLDNILTVPRGRLVHRMGSLSRDKIASLDAAIRLSLGLP